jgi:catalase
LGQNHALVNQLGEYTYHSVNTFRFTNSAGEQHHVRWSMQPQTAFVAMSPEEREAADD